MFNNHSMTVVTDAVVLASFSKEIDFFTIAAITTSDYPEYQNIYNAGVLVPPTQVLMDWANGAPYVLENEYPRYLSSRDPDEMIVALIAAMTKRNIILYIPYEDFKVFGMILLNHIYFQYGITCNFGATPFSVNPVKIPFIMAKFYMTDLMTANEFLSAYPGNAMLPEFTILKLADDLHPFNRPANFNEYAAYFNQVNASKLQEMQKMVRPIVRSEDHDSVHK